MTKATNTHSEYVIIIARVVVQTSLKDNILRTLPILLSFSVASLCVECTK